MHEAVCGGERASNYTQHVQLNSSSLDFGIMKCQFCLYTCLTENPVCMQVSQRAIENTVPQHQIPGYPAL